MGNIEDKTDRGRGYGERNIWTKLLIQQKLKENINVTESKKVEKQNAANSENIRCMTLRSKSKPKLTIVKERYDASNNTSKEVPATRSKSAFEYSGFEFLARFTFIRCCKKTRDCTLFFFY